MNDFKTVVMTPQIYRYVRRQAGRPTAAQEKLIARTAGLGASAEMQIPHEQAVLLSLLAKLIGARTVVEVGTYTGYSTLAFALALPPHGKVITCDVSAEWTTIAEEAWQAAGVRDRIDLRLGAAAQTLADLPEEPVVDLVFIDADKAGYARYWDLLVPRVRQGGLLLADNTLYGGEAAAEEPEGNAAAIDAFNTFVLNDPRVESVLVPIADGMTVARKK
ncbi:caffeoyl-CoA O-methyltransferase [Lentzea xinjiangensis]|uniref:Caffeoyl-CoA O-methyltransferase n=1 Tax=Lentzea xinjiangensis TaxID=402600 RepID=A0A1H9QW04_9PSEU|nr:O-methyltransferase [Lentzea xinjiangensis]SER64662.1 caffeoyl-CoA O-methyltransferase [Lentzea xinjiangensis]